MKEQILSLRAEGKSYDEIQAIVGCSKGNISYHCGQGQKQKTRQRTKTSRGKSTLVRKREQFYCKKSQFARRGLPNKKGKALPLFTLEELREKIGDNYTCYLSGRKIDINDSRSYHFDHIIPVSRGGDNSLGNLGLSDATINKMKHNLTDKEFIDTCKEVLEHYGYKIIKDEAPS
jgi:CRISPR/Cas system Type II protein with McrA/HNH and RuvC-like nuclease domain